MANLNFNINSKAITDMAKMLQSDRYTAMAKIAAQDMGITESEMPQFMLSFHENMKASKGVLDSIHHALATVILNEDFMNETIAKCILPNPEPLQSAYHYSLN